MLVEHRHRHLRLERAQRARPPSRSSSCRPRSSATSRCARCRPPVDPSACARPSVKARACWWQRSHTRRCRCPKAGCRRRGDGRGRTFVDGHRVVGRDLRDGQAAGEAPRVRRGHAGRSRLGRAGRRSGRRRCRARTRGTRQHDRDQNAAAADHGVPSTFRTRRSRLPPGVMAVDRHQLGLLGHPLAFRDPLLEGVDGCGVDA